MLVDELTFDGAGLVPVLAQDRHTGEVRMVAYADREAVQRTLDTGQAHFYSRSRATLWRKGESSGNTLAVAEVWADCDRDALIYLVDPVGPTCHTGRRSCFFAPIGRDIRGRSAAPTFVLLGHILQARTDATAERSYTRSLLDQGAAKIGAKLCEEAEELGQALKGESDTRVVSEAADVLYHLMVGLLSRGQSLRDVAAELHRRFGQSGLDEKASRAGGD